MSTSALIQNVMGRRRRSLDGGWNVIVDPYKNGLITYHRVPKQDGFSASRTQGTQSAPVEHDYDASPTLRVPGDWNSQRPELLYYEGPVWYRRKLAEVVSPDNRTFLYFEAANHTTQVWLNDELLGKNVGGFLPFCFEVTGKLTGEDELVVLVDNSRHAHDIPTTETDWWNYGGLTRSVHLVSVPRSFVVDYRIGLAAGRTDVIEATLTVDAAPGAEAVLQIPELDVELRGQVVDDGRCTLRVEVTPELWSPDNPKLYTVVVGVGDDRVEDQVGFRTIQTKGSDILLNGEPVFLRGVSVHEERIGPGGGRANTLEDCKRLLQVVQDLGCNFVRLAHYPHNELMVREAERRGLMVWAEIPVYWSIAWTNEATLSDAKQQLRTMIARDKNRAAVVLWSVGNETPNSAPRMAFMSQLCATAREADSSRLITAALEHRHVGEVRVVDDPLGQHLDVIGINQYIGWYDGRPPRCRSTRWHFDYDKPVVISEFGAGAKFGHHGAETELWTEEYQAALYRAQLEMQQRIPTYRGASPWVLKDFRTPRRQLPKIQEGWNRKGLVSETGERKQAFDVLRAFYAEKARSS